MPYEHSPESTETMCTHARANCITGIDAFIRRADALAPTLPEADRTAYAAAVSRDFTFAIRAAAAAGAGNVLEMLLVDGRGDPAAHSNLALFLAVRGGHAGEVGQLLDAGRGVTPASPTSGP